jgi:NADH-quinone oxidoreductase subunit G
VKSEIDDVWEAFHDPKKTVVVQIAPAVRVAIGESFGLEPGAVATHMLVAALRDIGFDKVYDTAFTADLTIFEEATEFLGRLERGEDMPQFTSCCPAWVKLAEQYYPQLLDNLSSCKSPQQMFGALAKEVLPLELDVPREDLVVVSIMPCTAKKYEAGLEKFQVAGQRDVDHVLTTRELARMIVEAGIDFNRLEPESLDMPFGFKTGAGILFGTSGGVTEAVLRFAAEKVEGRKPDRIDFTEVRGQEGLREATVELGGKTLRLAIVHGLKNARLVAQMARRGECPYDFVEVMACPGGCVNGAGQPFYRDPRVRDRRASGIYAADKQLEVHCPQENTYVLRAYEDVLGEVGGEKAHRLLHTGYQNRRRLAHEEMNLHVGRHYERLGVTVCVGTSCHLKGAQKLLSALIRHVGEKGWDAYVDVKATFCMESCDRGPLVTIAGRVLEHCTFDHACEVLAQEMQVLLDSNTVRPTRTAYPTLADFENQTAASLLRYIETLQSERRLRDRKSGNGCTGCVHSASGTDCIHE